MITDSMRTKLLREHVGIYQSEPRSKVSMCLNSPKISELDSKRSPLPSQTFWMYIQNAHKLSIQVSNRQLDTSCKHSPQKIRGIGVDDPTELRYIEPNRIECPR